MKKINPKRLTVTVVGIVVVLGAIGYYVSDSKSNENNTPTTVSEANTGKETAAETKTTPNLATSFTEEQLLFLIEEEKLAHDVYTVMFQRYGATVFGNILQSESTHQGRVLTLMQARNIPDPRSTEIGAFKNRDLQSLYDKLITQGNQNSTEAYKVGVVIEEKDIADISTQLATATEQDIIDTLESLRKGSENHLRAFNRQLK